MGYFDDSLERLYDELSVVLSQDELAFFQRACEEKCTLKLLPNFFFVVIDLARYLLHKIHSISNYKKKNKAEVDNGMASHQSEIREYCHKKRKRICKITKQYSTFENTPIEILSNSFSYLPIKKCLNADNFGNRFFQKVALNYLNKFERLDVTIDLSKCVIDFPVEECKITAQKITHLRFTGINNQYLTKEATKTIKRVSIAFVNLQKMYFEGMSVYNLYFDHQDATFSNLIFQSTKTLKQLKHIEFEDTCYSTGNDEYYEPIFKRLLERIKNISKITVNFVHVCKTYEYTL